MIAICTAQCFAVLQTGEQPPAVRMVRVGGRRVPWHCAGGMDDSFDAVAHIVRFSGHGVHGLVEADIK